MVGTDRGRGPVPGRRAACDSNDLHYARSTQARTHTRNHATASFSSRTPIPRDLPQSSGHASLLLWPDWARFNLESRMAGFLLCEPTMLYNILNQTAKHSRLAETNYLYLLDVRTKREYDESHIITAQRMKQKGGEYVVPESMDLECVKYCIVYDGRTNSLEVNVELEALDNVDTSEGEEEDNVMMGAAIEGAKVLAEYTRHPVYILNGGYERFSASYHFFRTQKIFSMPQELDAFEPYPIEIVPGEVYLGTVRQACSSQIHKHLKVKAHINVCLETTPFFEGSKSKLLHIKVTDSPGEDLFSHFRLISHFMDAHIRLGSVVLVFSTLGISRSCTVVLAYLMHRNRESLRRSWAHMQNCKNNIRPNRGFVHQLVEWEKVIHGAVVTDVSDPLY
ncbi:serine/threonine/tyrosine-interacting-like protein 1 isoform X3 [Notamacropus eugenii]|uniref:serine/threonine/tyrosine-interacting-like protein 1 isoform X3 n=3 Tax=Notamacropus eugenii TaxID=9315 RepID=UPI003B681861